MKPGSWEAVTHRMDPEGVTIEVLGRPLRLHNQQDPVALREAVEILERSFRDMEEAYRLRWGCPPSAQDTTTWLLLGALNLAYRIGRLEQEATRQTKDLEITLSKLLDDVPVDNPPPKPLLEEGE
ncbi:MAG: cell division protein ZapA [Acidobacteria bacterium]|nr:cell division protein ZapA [Acidobacteriota bacterium]